MTIVNVVESGIIVITLSMAVVPKKLKDFGAKTVLSSKHFKNVPSAKRSFVKTMAISIRKSAVDYFFCGNEEDEDEESCLRYHKTKRRECGHLTCNFNKGGCIVCKGDGDVQMVKDLKKNCKSASLKKCLTVWLKETQALSKKANKEKGKSLKATPSNQSSKKKEICKVVHFALSCRWRTKFLWLYIL